MKSLVFIAALDRRLKTLIISGIDAAIALSVTLAVFAFQNGIVDLSIALIVALFAAVASIATGASRIMLRALEVGDVIRVALFSALVGAAFFALSRLADVPVALFGAIMVAALQLCVSMLARVTGASVIARIARQEGGPQRAIIYGAGKAGQQLKGMLRNSDDYAPVAFVDDNPSMQGAMIGGLKVRKPAQIEKIIAKTGATKVLLAIPSLSAERRREILGRLRTVSADILTLPSYSDLIRTNDILSALRTVDPSELLGRDAVELDMPEIRGGYSGKSVFISGAGGSIGSELCRQVMEAAPKRLVLFEISEFALYSIHMELQKHRFATHTEIIPILGSVCDQTLVTRLLRDHSVEIVLHAAAYKHVPLVESNPLEAARNNVIGTRAAAIAARDAGVDRFILVSTDKAVRPTNVMGATKRLAELVIQDIQTRSEHTLYSMVRFGNVLGSSGSVIPLFQKQISEGGPITVTHPEVTRYFMTIPEAARLVLLAGSFMHGGEVFVLDMGAPVRISDLARRLVEVSGLTVRDRHNPDGDIEIDYVGLRPGEKLFEELLIDGNTVSTPHEKILRAIEGSRSELEVAAAVRKLQAGIEASDPEVVRPVLSSMVDGYNRPQKAIVTTLQNETA